MIRFLLLVASLAPWLNAPLSRRPAAREHVTVSCIVREGDAVVSLPRVTTVSGREATIAWNAAALVFLPSIQEDGTIEIAARVQHNGSVVTFPKAWLKSVGIRSL